MTMCADDEDEDETITMARHRPLTHPLLATTIMIPSSQDDNDEMTMTRRQQTRVQQR